jgi:hypothetical protein
MIGSVVEELPTGFSHRLAFSEVQVWVLSPRDTIRGGVFTPRELVVTAMSPRLLSMGIREAILYSP